MKLKESLRVWGLEEKYKRWLYYMENRNVFYYILAMMDVPY